MSDLLCTKCGQPIRPGDQVDFVFAGEGEPRIIVDDEVLFAHVTCPEVTPMTPEQREALVSLAARYNVPFNPYHVHPRTDLPEGWVACWVGPIYVGVSPTGEVHS
jgi:hypothetical protein